MNLIVGNVTRKKIDKRQRECKKPITYDACEDYVWNPSACACECDKDSDMGEYLNNCTSKKSLADDLVVICDETENTPNQKQQ